MADEPKIIFTLDGKDRSLDTGGATRGVGLLLPANLRCCCCSSRCCKTRAPWSLLTMCIAIPLLAINEQPHKLGNLKVYSTQEIHHNFSRIYIYGFAPLAIATRDISAWDHPIRTRLHTRSTTRLYWRSFNHSKRRARNVHISFYFHILPNVIAR